MKISEKVMKAIMIFTIAFVMLLGSIATAFAANAKVTVAFDTKGGEKISSMTGKEGEALYLPKPEREGYIFAGWYNQSGDKLFLDTVFPNKNVDLYAKWDIRGTYAGFENFEVFDTPGSLSVTARCKLTTEDAASGQFSLLYDHNVVDNATMALATVSFIDDRGYTYKFISGAEYILTFKYKVVSASKPGNFGVISSEDLAPWRNRVELVTNHDKNGYSEEDVGKGWQTKTIKFKADEMKKNGEYFGFAISGCGKIYVDDILIRINDENAQYKGNVIEFYSNGGTFVKPVYGDFGKLVKVPEEIEKEGYNFVGWYDDPELIKEVEEISISYANTVVYADWYVDSKPQAPTQNTVGGTDEDPDEDLEEDPDEDLEQSPNGDANGGGTNVGGNASQSTSSDVPTQSDEPVDRDSMDELIPMNIVYIVIAAIGVVVVASIAVAIVVICKSKAKKTKTEPEAEQTNEQEAK